MAGSPANGRSQAVQLGADLRELRKHAGKTVVQVAEALGMHHSTISRWERGDTMPDEADTAALLAIYGIVGEDRDRLVRLARHDTIPDWVAPRYRPPVGRGHRVRTPGRAHHRGQSAPDPGPDPDSRLRAGADDERCLMLRWRKSRRSGANGQTACVELAHDYSAVRDSKNPDGPVLTVDVRALLAHVVAQ